MSAYDLPYAEVDACAMKNMAYLNVLFPNNKIEGRELVCGDIYGASGRSFKFNLDHGKWGDFSFDKENDPDKYGKGIVDLVAKRNGIKESDACKQVAHDIGFLLPTDTQDTEHIGWIKLPGKVKKTNKKTTGKDADRYSWKYQLPEETKTKLPKFTGRLDYNNPDYTFSFKDENGNEIYQKIRFEPKGCKKEQRFRRRKEDGGWIYKSVLVGIRRVPYNLPDIINSDNGGLYIVEGEKHADKLIELGFLATSSKDWKKEYNFAKYFTGKIVYIIPDFDQSGRDQAINVALQCKEADIRTKIVELDGLTKQGDDILDWLKIDGNTPGKLTRLASEAPYFDLNPITESEQTTEVQESTSAFVSQISVAESFESLYKDDLKYDARLGLWFRWTGDVWEAISKEFTKNIARNLCKQTSEQILSSECDNSKRLAGIVASQNFSSGVELLCRSNTDVFTVNYKRDTPSIWDNDNFLLGVPGGVVDLKTGLMREARREDFITKQCTVAPSETIDAPRWIQFLSESTGGDAEFINYLQEICGYFLTGDTSEQALFFVHGPGGNGKGVFLHILDFILGRDTYSKTASLNAFVDNKNEQHPTDLASLCGARLVSVSETESGKAWAEAKIKQLTGGDKISARFMRQDFFTFLPTFKLLIIGNHKPVIRNLDDAIRRRLHLIPFENKPEVPDLKLEKKLEAEAPGILRWMIAGCLRWQKNRLQMPKAVKEATQSYFCEEDDIAHWISECCVTGSGFQAKSSVLFNSWAEFARKNGLEAKISTNKSLSRDLVQRGFKKDPNHKRDGVFFYGIGLKAPEVEDAESRRYPN